MKRLLWVAPCAALFLLGVAALQSEVTVGPFRLAPDSSWTEPREGSVFGLQGWLLERPGTTRHTLHLASASVAFSDDKDRQRKLTELARAVGEEHPGGFKASTGKLAGVDTVLARFVEGDETVFRYFPYNAQRIFTVTLVVGRANSDLTDAGKRILGTVRLPDPPYKAPKRDFLSGLLGALEGFSKELDKLNDVLSGKPPKETGKTDTSKDSGDAKKTDPEKPPILGDPVRKNEEVAVSVPWVRVDQSGATVSDGLAKTDRLWAPIAEKAPEQLPGEPVVLPAPLDLTLLAKTMPGGHARVAAAALREMMGQIPAADLAKLQAKLAPALAHPTEESEAYFEKLIPVLQEALCQRAAAVDAAEEFDAAWLEARIAAEYGAEGAVREALDIADRQREMLVGIQNRLASLAQAGQKLGVAPNPIAQAMAQEQEYRQTVQAILKAIESIAPKSPPPANKTIVWNYSGKVPANWTVQKLPNGLRFERKKVETPKTEGHWQSNATAAIEVGFPTKVGPGDKPANAAEAMALLKEKFEKRPQGFTPNDMAVGLTKQGGIEGASAFSIGEFQGAIVDYAIWRRRGTAGMGFTPGYNGAGGEGFVFAEGYRIAFRYSVSTSSCFDNCQLQWENQQALAAQREARAILQGLNPKGTGVFETVPETPVEGAGEDPVDKLPPDLRETVQMHAENIRFIKGTIQRLEAELATETDPARRGELEYRLLLSRSDVIREEDLITSHLTGQVVARRTPFDDYAHTLFIQNIRENQQRMERFSRAQAALQRLAGMLPPGEAEEARRFIDRQIDRKAMASMDFDKVRQVAQALHNKATGYFEMQQAKGEEEAAWAQLGLDAAQNIKSAADNSLSILSLFGGRPVMIAYQAATGYTEGGPMEALLRSAAWCGTPAYIASEAIRGYSRVDENGERRGWLGAAQDAASAFVIGKAFEYGAGKAAQWLKGKGAAGASFTEAELAEFNRRRAAGERTAKAFVEAQKALQAAGKRGASAQEIRRLQERAMRAAQAVNEDPHAKNFLKYRGDPASQRGYNAHLSATHAEVEARFHENMQRRGWSRAPMKEFRNASSRGSVGMDYDIGLDESQVGRLTKGGQPRPLHEWQREAQQAWDEAYQQVTGRSAKRSWETVTTSAHAEAYKDLNWLSSNKEGIQRAWAQQAADVTRYKNWHMAASGLDKLTALQENSRGTAKDIETKLLGLFWRNLPQGQRSGQAMQNARQKWEAIQKVLSMFGSNQIDPVTASERIRRITGGRDIPQVLDDAAMMIESLAKNAGR